MQASTRFWSATAVTLLMSLATATMAGCGRADASTPLDRSQSESAGEATRPVAVRTVTIEPRDLVQGIDYVGTVRYQEQIKLSASVGGTLESQLVEEGQRIDAGVTVAQIATPELQVRRRGILAELRRAKAQKRQACDVARTDRRLAKRGALSDSRAAASMASCRTARHAVSAATSKRDEIDVALANSTLNAPKAGQVLSWLVEPGETVGPGRPVLLVGVGHKEISVQVTVDDLMRGIAVGLPVLIRAPNDTRTRGKVTHVAPMATGPGRHVALRVELAPELALLPVGAAVDVQFVLEEAPASFAVPQRALLPGAGPERAVFVVHDDVVSTFRFTPGLQQQGWIATDPAIPAGSQVVTTNLGMIADGTRVLTVQETSL